MPYDMQRRLAKLWSEVMQMVPEEADVWHSLDKAGYKFLHYHEGPTIRDFTPLSTLYMVYLRYVRSNLDPDNPNRSELTMQQFGAAFKAVTENSLKKSRRWVTVDGRRQQLWGYAGVLGPGSYTVQPRRGRPRNP